ncbi:MAG: V-type ATPase 116kDa subunit family protein, partial [Bacillota bacterium]|nr:V-type ATPase 116kDa subunit family protein [Bacillota bacterium]
MIVRMRRLRVIALSRAERGLIRDLGRLGCVEIESSLNDPDGTGVAGLLKPFGVKGDSEKKYNAVSSALGSLSRYSPSKPKFLTPRCRVKEAEFENETNTARALELASRINGITEKFAGLSADERRLESRKAAILPWKTLDIPLDYAGGRRFAVLLGTCPSVYRVKDIEQELSSAAPESELTLVFSDKEQHYFSLVCHRGVLEKAADALRKFGFSKTDPGVSGKTALEALSGLDSELQGIKGERAALEREIASLSSSRPLLEQAVDFLSFDVLRDETLNKLGSTKETVYMECWLPAETEAPVKKILEESDCAYMFSDPSDAEEPPVALKNSPAVSPFSTITEMYGLPNYTSVVDPNPFVAFFYFLFFGMMLSDAAYGLCMVVFGLIVLKKARPSGMVKNIMQLSVALGVSTFFWGAVFGSWFGDCIPVVSKMLTGKEFNLPFVIEPMSNPIAVLILALGLGVLHIFVGMGLSAYRMIKQGHIKDAVF